MKAKVFIIILYILISQNSYSQWVGKFQNFGDNKTVYSLVFNNGVLFAATGAYGVSYTSSNGDDWSSELTYQTIDGTVRSMILNENRFYASVDDSGVYTSMNGYTWTRTSLGDKEVYSIAANSNIVYAGTWGKGVFKSTNFGATWDSSGLSGMRVTALAISGNYIFAGTNNSTTPKGIYISTNGGANWTQSSLNNKVITSFALQGTNIYASTYNQNPSGVYISTNFGVTWTITALNNKLVNNVYSFDNKLFAGVYNGGVYYSSNNGSTWKTKNEGFPPTSLPSVYCFAVANGYIIEGNYGWSVWRRSYSETIDIKQLSTEVPDGYKLEQNYPNPFNPTTTINFSIPKESILSLIIYDASGKQIQRLLNNENIKAGAYEINFNGNHLTSGVYFYRFEAGDFATTKKMILIK